MAVRLETLGQTSTNIQSTQLGSNPNFERYPFCYLTPDKYQASMLHAGCCGTSSPASVKGIKQPVGCLPAGLDAGKQMRRGPLCRLFFVRVSCRTIWARSDQTCFTKVVLWGVKQYENDGMVRYFYMQRMKIIGLS